MWKKDSAKKEVGASSYGFLPLTWSITTVIFGSSNKEDRGLSILRRVNGMRVPQNALDIGQHFLLVEMGMKKDKAESRAGVPPTAFGGGNSRLSAVLQLCENANKRVKSLESLP